MAQFLSQKELMNIIGSWNKEGFHGHNRSKSRIENSNSFRLSAKPSPPEKFKIRFKDNATKHHFSHHDNKQAFLNDCDLFSRGVGRRKVETSNKDHWNPELIAWKNEAGRGREGPKKTLYQRDFCVLTSPSKLLLNRQRYETPLVSSYTESFSHGEPRKETSRTIKADLASRYAFQRAKTCINREKSSVAHCMVWKNAPPAISQSSNPIEAV